MGGRVAVLGRCRLGEPQPVCPAVYLCGGLRVPHDADAGGAEAQHRRLLLARHVPDAEGAVVARGRQQLSVAAVPERRDPGEGGRGEGRSERLRCAGGEVGDEESSDGMRTAQCGP